MTLLLALPAFCNKQGSGYGGNTDSTCGTSSFSGVTATCYVGSGQYPDDFVFNFTLANPSPATSVTSFTTDFGTTAPIDFGLVVGPCELNGVLIVPCASNYAPPAVPPFDVTGTLGTGTQTFDFSGFTGDQSGQVSVYFTYAATTPNPTITDITTTTTAATPEPGPVFLVGTVLTGFLAFFRLKRCSQ